MTQKSSDTRYQGNFLNKGDVLGFPIRELQTRLISEGTAKHFGIRCSVNESTGEIDKHYFPYYVKDQLAHWKIRELPNKDSGIGSAKKVDPFGWHLLKGGKKLIVTEGEYDCATVYQVMLSHMQERGYPGVPEVTSLPAGATSAKAFIKEKGKEIQEKWGELILCLDHDEAGDSAVKDIMMLHEGPVKQMVLPKKDANDTLQEVGSQAIIDAFYKAALPKLGGMVLLKDIFNEMFEEDEQGWNYPWDVVTQQTGGMRSPEFFTIVSGSGGGKTDFVTEVVRKFIIDQDCPVSFYSLEMSKRESASRIVGKQVQQRDINKSDLPQAEHLKEQCGKLLDKLSFYDIKSGELDISTLLRMMKQEIMTRDSKVHVIDNLTQLTAGSKTERTAIDDFTKSLKFLAEAYDLRVFLIVHLNRDGNNKLDFEEGARIRPRNIFGSGGPMKWSHTVLALERNQYHSDLEVRNTTIGRWLKGRKQGSRLTGSTFALKYNQETGCMEETEVVDIIEKENEGDF